jgi:hypothetical protein
VSRIQRERRPELSRFAAVAFEEPAKPLFATNVRQGNCGRFSRLRSRPLPFGRFSHRDQLILEALVWPFLVIVDFEFLAQNIHMLVTEDDEVIKAFLLDRLDESFGVGDHIRRANQCSLHLDLSLLQCSEERFGEFSIIVVHQDFALWSFVLGRFDKRFGLPNHPCFVRFVVIRSVG